MIISTNTAGIKSKEPEDGQIVIIQIKLSSFSNTTQGA